MNTKPLECYRFIYWLTRGMNLMDLFKIVYRRVYYRFIRMLLGRNNNYYYPSSIKALLNEYDKNECIESKTLEKNIFYDRNYSAPKSVQLASIIYPVINKKIDWNNNFIDSEDEESLHRWNWLIMLASDKKFNKNKLSWLLYMQKDWIKSFQDEVRLPNRKLCKFLRWESYSISERLSNSVILFHCYDCKPDAQVHQALLDQAMLLTTRIEYLGDYTCNHIINNARALYLIGTYFDYVYFNELAREIFFLELPKFVTGDGFLREGSSHYQLLFTRWMLEVAYFATVSNDMRFKKFFEPYLKNLICQSSFFFVRSAECKTQIPLFGDISPDFPPEWLINMLDTIDDSFEKNEMLPEKSWNRLWSLEKNPTKKIGLNNVEILSKRAIQTYPDSGWYKFLHGPFEIFIRLDEDGVPNYVGHHHQDSGHFCLYYEGIPILVDGGRLDYQNSFGVEPEAHNTLSLNGLGLVPRKVDRFPRSYSNCIQSIKYKLDKDYLLITLTSNGFSRIQTGLIWTRSLLINSSKIKMIDEFKGKGDFNISSYLHFAVGTKISEDNSGNWECKKSKTNFQCKMEHINELKTEIYEGGESPLGWQAVAYGKKLEAPTIKISGLVSLPKSIVSTLNFK